LLGAVRKQFFAEALGGVARKFPGGSEYGRNAGRRGLGRADAGAADFSNFLF